MLETNRKLFSSRKTKHIKSKLFFIKDKVNNEEVKIVDCPEGVMWADVLTKPLHGTAFREGPVDEMLHGVHLRGGRSS